MARCAHCDETIHYGGYWLGVMRNAGRNMTSRARLMPITTCGHCGEDNVQRAPYAILQLVTYVATIALLFVTGVGQGAGRGTLFLQVFGSFLIIDGLWWTFVARLRRLDD